MLFVIAGPSQHIGDPEIPLCELGVDRLAPVAPGVMVHCLDQVARDRAPIDRFRRNDAVDHEAATGIQAGYDTIGEHAAQVRALRFDNDDAPVLEDNVVRQDELPGVAPPSLNAQALDNLPNQG